MEASASDMNRTGALPIRTRGVVALDLVCEPGQSIGPFVLGTPLGDVLDLIKSRFLVIPKAEFKYSDQKPLDLDLVVNVPRNGISMRFDATTQRLKTIELYDFAKFRLAYRGQEFNSTKTVPTFVLIYKVFGPIYPGEVSEGPALDSEKRYILHYPGISFVFPVPPKHWPLHNVTDLPLSFADGSSPVLNRVYVYGTGSQWKNVIIPSVGASDYYFEEALIELKMGVTFSKRGSNILFGSSAQEVLAELGKPSRVFSKDTLSTTNTDTNNNGSRANSPNADVLGASIDGNGGESYVWNYFQMGVDVVFDCRAHTVKKIVLRTNFPGHPDFNRYRRCNFKISPQIPSEPDSPSLGPTRLLRHIDGRSKYDDITRILGQPLGPPVIYSRQGGSNPFGSTSYFGFDAVIFEIMKNSHIASVTVF